MKKGLYLVIVCCKVIICCSMDQPHKSSRYRSRLFQIAAQGTPEQMKRFEPDHKLKDIYRTTVSGSRKTVLHHASRTGNLSMVKHILEKIENDDAIINALDNEYKTPLYDALAYGHTKVAEELREHGAQIRISRGPKRSITVLTPTRRYRLFRQKNKIENYLISKNEDLECDICCEQFNESNRIKVVSDSECMRIVCAQCKKACDKCPFCRMPYLK
jgi:hypothetical protein